jgi:hypothetical protein
MSIPTIVVSPSNVPSTIQFSTPFSYTFSNSSIYNQEEVPAYGGNQPITVTTSSPYSPNYAYINTGDARGILVASSRRPYTFDYIFNASEFTFTVPDIGTIQKTGYIKFSSNSWTFYRQVDGFGFNDYIIDTINNTYVLYAGYSFVGTPVTIRYVKQSNGFQVFSNSTLLFTEPPSDLTFRSLINWVGFGEATFIVGSPNNVTPTYPLISLFGGLGGTSAEILSSSFITGSSTPQLTFSSSNGFQTIPSSNLTISVYQEVSGVQIGIPVSYTFTVTPISITTSPTLGSTLSLYTYQPFSYTYSIPGDVVNVLLQYNSNVTSSSLIPYISGDTFASTLGLTVPGTTTIRFDALLSNVLIASNQTTITTIAPIVTITPEIPTGSLNLYKYEPFSYVFALNTESVGLVLQFNRSSSELQTFLAVSEDLQSVTFLGTFLISYSSPLTLIVDLLVGSTIISTQTILVSVGPGRFFPPTQNQNFQLYQYENVSNTFGSNIEFLTAAPMTIILSSPSLPSGLTFGGSGNSFFIQGTPNLQVTQSNYQIIGSNSSNGRIVTSTISLRVNPQQIRITPSASTLTGLIVDIPIDPIITTAIRPATIYSNTFRYTWNALPDGLNFQNSLGSNVSQPFEPLDGPLTITLVGAPSLAFATSLSTSAENLYQTRLTATQTNQTGAQTIGTSLFNFSLGETVLVTVSNTVTLYKDKPLGTTDVLITAGSFFSSATISNITTDSLPPGLSLVEYISPRVYRLTGTPTEVNLSGSYTFTATNTNENSRSVTVSIPINPDVVTFVGDTPANGTVLSYILSKTVTPLVFSATSTSTTIAPTYTSSITLENYGLTLNSVTGILSGTPTTLLSSTTVTITATNIFGTIGTTTIVVTILPDVFTWPTYTPSYFQNEEITPFKFSVSTLSGRPILSYSSTDLPMGLFINLDGLLLGAPTVGSSGSFTIIASTGYTISSQVYTYTIIGDQLVILQNNGIDTISVIFGPNENPIPSNENPIGPNENLIVVGGSGASTIISSPDGITWTSAISSPIGQVNGIAWNGSYWVAVGVGATKIATSLDGITWTGRGGTVVDEIDGLNGVAWNGSYWVAVGVGPNNTIITSPDGIIWTGRGLVFSYRGLTVASNGSYWVAGGEGTNTLVTSPDGINWTRRNSSIITRVKSVAWNGSYWVAVGEGSASIETSPDGINWTTRGSGTMNVLRKVAWNGSFWIVLEDYPSSNIRSSSDGINWTPLSSTSLEWNYDIIWNGSLWVVVGGNSTLATSPNGINWTSTNIPMTFGMSLASKFVLIPSQGVVPSQGVQYSVIQYSSDSFVDAVFSIGALSPATLATVSVTSGGLLSGNFVSYASLNTTYSATLTATYETVTSSTPIYIVFTSLLGSGTGTVRIPTELTTLTFSQPTQTTLVLYQYIPYSIPIQAVGSGSFIYYYSSTIPTGFQLIRNSSGTIATLSGISPTLSDQGILIYAKIAGGAISSILITLRTITPFFINPQVGAGAYTALLKNDVEGNAAQNARDNRTFPEVNPLAGPLMAPRAPDVVTPNDCILKLCKKPCPTCHTMM